MKFLSFVFVSLFLFINMATAQNCTPVCPDNIIVRAGQHEEGATVTYPEQTNTTCKFTYSPASGSFFRLGSHTVTVTSYLGQKCTFTITVTDNESPTLSPLSLSRSQLWPASGKMKKVSVGYTASDNGQAVKTTINVSSNAGEGAGDFQVIDDHLLRLKSARLADGSPRIYTITVTATDDSGNKTTRTTTIAVSNTMVAKPAK